MLTKPLDHILGSAICSLALLFLSAVAQSQPDSPNLAPLAWPEITREAKPWTRWWWMGSAVNSNGLSASLTELRDIGLGGVEITPIYGVAGYEDQFVPYLSTQWMDLLSYTLREASRLDLGVDIATGTGWPFGGPWVDASDACKYVTFDTLELNGGERLSEAVSLQQRPLVRAVGNQIYQLYGEILRAQGEVVIGSAENPQLRAGARRINISDLLDPISANTNLQALALDQVRFPKPLQLQALVVRSDSGKTIDLTHRVNGEGMLDWTAPEGRWTLYAVFQGWHGKMVERAAPGGEGNVIDHFSTKAIRDYLRQFDRAFAGHDTEALRGFFNDSYEVDDASGQSDWTPRMFAEFVKRRGYDLRKELPALFGGDSADKNARVLCDFRETISDLLLDTFTTEWRKWAHRKDAVVRNQAHGSPANLLDLYAASDIPETEGTDLLRIKFASSAAHVTGRQLVSSESATWLNEHFRSTLWDVKQALDRYFLGGVNHIFYHGTCYSPQDDAWPGWLFYAAVHFDTRNSWWEDFSALNAYVARVQSFLQQGKPDRDVLLYFPIHDSFSTRGDALIEHFDGSMRRLANAAFRDAAETLDARGFHFDFISDRQLKRTKSRDGKLITEGGEYQAMVVPQCQYIPLETFQKLIALGKAGGKIVFFRGMPGDVAGFGNLSTRQRRFSKLKASVRFQDDARSGIKEVKLGEGRFVLGDDLDSVLEYAGVDRERLVDNGLQSIRRSRADGRCYFIANRGEEAFSGWTPLRTHDSGAALFDPMSGESGVAASRMSAGGDLEVYLQLAPGQTCLLQTSKTVPRGPRVDYYTEADAAQTITGQWRLTFVSGGPELPVYTSFSQLRSWTELGDQHRAFSGTADYALEFGKPDSAAAGWWLDLGKVHDSARVRLNGVELGTLIGEPWRVYVPDELLRDQNALVVRVSNLMANRIADLDRRELPWKKFYNVNFPARLAVNRDANGLFTAAKWEPLPSGLMGPVMLTPVKPMNF